MTVPTPRSRPPHPASTRPRPARAPAAHARRAGAQEEGDPLFHGLLGTLSILGVVFMAWAYTTPYAHSETLDAAVALAAKVPVPAHWDPIVMATPFDVRLPDEPPVEHVSARPARPTQPPASGMAASRTAAPRAPGHSMLLQELGTFGASGTEAILDRADADPRFDAAIAGVDSAREASVGAMGPKHGSSDRLDARLDVTPFAPGAGVGVGAGAALAVRTPVVVAAPPFIPAGDEAAIGAVIARNNGRITSCLEQALKAEPGLNGRIAVGFLIRGGQVTDAHMVANTTGAPALGTCVVQAVRHIRFAPDVEAEVAEYPWVVSGR